MDATSLARARSALDAANAADPEREGDRAAALAYADAIDRWVERLVPSPSAALRIASRGQHLERWAIPRDREPMDRAGYLRWRVAVHARQGERTRELLAGLLDAADIDRVAILVAKKAPKGDPEGQALEDAACLTFLEREIAGFASKHADYSPGKYVTILRRTFAKMSPAAKDLVAALPLEEPFAGLVRTALVC